MKTAAEMRATNPKFTVKNVLKEIEAAIERVNSGGTTNTRFTTSTTHPDRFDWIRLWTYGEDCIPLDSIVLELRRAGYTVTSWYEDNQFTDMDIMISWEE